ncbi:MAG: hypothetical protein WC509_03390 [Candidatus Izemoplasmatales bacterium]
MERPFKNTPDFTEADWEALKKVKVTLEKRVNPESGYVTCYATIHLHQLLQPKMKLTEDRLNLIRMRTNRQIFDKNGYEILKHTFMAPYRMVTGTIKGTDRKYKSVQVIFGQQLTEVHFFNDFNQSACLAELEKNVGIQGKEKLALDIEWETAPDPIDSDKNFSFEAE